MPRLVHLLIHAFTHSILIYLDPGILPPGLSVVNKADVAFGSEQQEDIKLLLK